MISFNKYYQSLISNNDDIQQKYLQEIHDDEIPKQNKEIYYINNNPIDVKYGFNDKQSLLFEIHKNFPEQPDFKIGVDLIYLIDISQKINDETLEKIKQALQCLINYLDDKNRLCIIIYNNKADKLFSLIPLNEKNRQIIQKAIEQITLQQGNSNILNALLVANLCLKLRQFKNQITSVIIISQDDELPKNSYYFKQIFEKEIAFKLKIFLLLSKKHQSSTKIKKGEINKFQSYQIVNYVDQLSSFLCYYAFKLQQTVIMNLSIIVKSHKYCPIQISECEGGKFQYVNPYEIKITKNLISIGYNKAHLVCVQNSKISDLDKICEIEVSFQQISSNSLLKYSIPIYAQESNGIIDNSVIVQKYKYKSRSQMIEAILYYDPYRIQDCTEILKNYLSEVANLPDDIKQQLSVETKQFEDTLQKYYQQPLQQIPNPFIEIDDLRKKQKLECFFDKY
ncbi:unnamed protein product [Paramecium pentaurelia]|uniref:VWFA domain-containing protein n=1 Tax=Paramecium pentaurelia TaxID=43138 RepID=A0A8S1SLH3_9CILI|nr:unnamed protein product [Paramecium pentaurelia]